MHSHFADSPSAVVAAPLHLKIEDSATTAPDATWKRCTECAQAGLEVACHERHCTVDIPISLDVRQDPAYPRDGSITLSAGIGGGASGGGACSDQTKDSSTDTDSAPLGLQLKLTIGEFEDVPVPDGEWLDSGTMPPVTMDGGLREGGVLDAGERDARDQDGGALHGAGGPCMLPRPASSGAQAMAEVHSKASSVPFGPRLGVRTM